MYVYKHKYIYMYDIYMYAFYIYMKARESESWQQYFPDKFNSIVLYPEIRGNELHERNYKSLAKRQKVEWLKIKQRGNCGAQVK